MQAHCLYFPELVRFGTIPFMDNASQLRETIVNNLKAGTWRAGHRIPTERELCDQFAACLRS